jgi:sugar (pentulose or hexulose) kinase
MAAQTVILIFDIGRANKKLLLFDELYRMVYEEKVQLPETIDEDGFPCEDIWVLTSWIKTSIARMLLKTEFEVVAVNFSAYGASLVYVDENLVPILPLYNFLKPYPAILSDQFYNTYGGPSEFSKQTASPVLGSYNSGMQLYRIKYEKPEAFAKIKYAMHLPQYLSSVVSGNVYSEVTSLGCHTNLWDFSKMNYHDWVETEQLKSHFPPILPGDSCITSYVEGKTLLVGIGLHDGSAALIPYFFQVSDPFILLSTGPWCICLNPFADSSVTASELERDCLCYLTWQGAPVKASRLFAGNRLTEAIERGVADHQLIIDLVTRQLMSTNLVQRGTDVKHIFIEGGFSRNSVYMDLMAAVLPNAEIYSSSATHASALGAALALHKHWNKRTVPSDMIELKYYADATSPVVQSRTLK